MVGNNTLIMLLIKKVVAVKKEEIKFHLKILEVGVSHGASAGYATRGNRLTAKLGQNKSAADCDRHDWVLHATLYSNFHRRFLFRQKELESTSNK